jgi:hypothetical protein
MNFLISDKRCILLDSVQIHYTREHLHVSATRGRMDPNGGRNPEWRIIPVGLMKSLQNWE